MRAEAVATALFACALAVDAHAEAAPSTGGRIAAAVAEAAQRFSLPANWLFAVMRRESAGDPLATSPKGAMGLMQLMPATWATLRADLRLGADPYDVHDNVLAGAAYLRQLYDQFGPLGFLAAYNAGPGRYLDFVSKGRPLPDETRAYVASIARTLGSPGVAVQSVNALTAAAAPSPPPSVFVRLGAGLGGEPTQPSGLFVPTSDK